jgi:hypothetical protein
MRSFIVMNVADDEAERAKYSDLKIMKSPAGYYVGTTYNAAGREGFDEPGSRDSDYFATEAEAQAFLSRLEKMTEDERRAHLRQYP